MSQAGRALAHAFETGALPRLRAFLLRAEPVALEDVEAEQSFRPEYLRLKQARWTVVPRLAGGGREQGLVLLTKHKEENFANVARAWEMLAPAPCSSAPAATTTAWRASRRTSPRRSAA